MVSGGKSEQARDGIHGTSALPVAGTTRVGETCHQHHSKKRIVTVGVSTVDVRSATAISAPVAPADSQHLLLRKESTVLSAPNRAGSKRHTVARSRAAATEKHNVVGHTTDWLSQWVEGCSDELGHQNSGCNAPRQVTELCVPLGQVQAFPPRTVTPTPRGSLKRSSRVVSGEGFSESAAQQYVFAGPKSSSCVSDDITTHASGQLPRLGRAQHIEPR